MNPQESGEAKVLLGIQALGVAAGLAGAAVPSAEAATISPEAINQSLQGADNNRVQPAPDFRQSLDSLVDLKPGQSPIIWQQAAEPVPTSTPVPEKAPGVAAPLEGGKEGVDFVKVNIKSGDIKPDMKLVAGDGVPIRDEKASDYAFVKVDGQMVFLKPGEELDVYDVKEVNGVRYALVRRPDNWNSLPEDQRACAVYLGSPETASQMKDKDGKEIGNQLWKMEATGKTSPTATPIVDSGKGKETIDPVELDKPQLLNGKQNIYKNPEDTSNPEVWLTTNNGTTVQLNGREAKVIDGQTWVRINVLQDGQILTYQGRRLEGDWVQLNTFSEALLKNLSVQQLKELGFNVQEINNAGSNEIPQYQPLEKGPADLGRLPDGWRKETKYPENLTISNIFPIGFKGNGRLTPGIYTVVNELLQDKQGNPVIRLKHRGKTVDLLANPQNLQVGLVKEKEIAPKRWEYAGMDVIPGSGFSWGNLVPGDRLDVQLSDEQIKNLNGFLSSGDQYLAMQIASFCIY